MKRKISNTENFLLVLCKAVLEFSNVLPLPFEAKYSWVRRLRDQSGGQYYHNVSNGIKQKLISLYEKNGENFIALTEKGQLQILFAKAHRAYSGIWDHTWRLVMFDIPESSRGKKNKMRYLLRCNGFIKLQASVFVSPYPLQTDAVEYLKKANLKNYIRFVRADAIDDDRELKKQFGLS